MPMVKTPGFAERIWPNFFWRAPASSPEVYLTFDDGPCPEITPWTLDLLAEYSAKATFFLVGENVERHPEIVRRIAAEGHAIGNHTYSHVSGWSETPGNYLAQIYRADEAIKATLGFSPSLFRPPYGRLNLLASKKIQQTHKIVMWDVLARDFDPETEPAVCLDNVLRHYAPGSAIVLHDSLKCANTLRAVLPDLLTAFQAAGVKLAALQN